MSTAAQKYFLISPTGTQNASLNTGWRWFALRTIPHASSHRAISRAEIQRAGRSKRKSHAVSSAFPVSREVTSCSSCRPTPDRTRQVVRRSETGRYIDPVPGSACRFDIDPDAVRILPLEEIAEFHRAFCHFADLRGRG